MNRSKKVRGTIERVLGALEIVAGFGTRRRRQTRR